MYTSNLQNVDLNFIFNLRQIRSFYDFSEPSYGPKCAKILQQGFPKSSIIKGKHDSVWKNCLIFEISYNSEIKFRAESEKITQITLRSLKMDVRVQKGSKFPK